MLVRIFSVLFLSTWFSGFAIASGHEEFAIVNWYERFLHKVIGVFAPSVGPEELTRLAGFWSPVVASSFSVLVIVFLSFACGLARLKPEKMNDEEILPPKKFSLLAFFEICWDVVDSTLLSTFGNDHLVRRFGYFLGSIFFMLLVINAMGLIPGFEPATASMSFSFVAAIIVFLSFNFYGLKDAGWHYITHLAGPVLLMAPFIFMIELVSVLSRPVSLSLRITGNITGDHFVFSVFSQLLDTYHLWYLPIPCLFIVFGTLVAFLQAFIFMTLSAVYIKLAIESKGDH